ncbi:MAG: hypothetical protein HYS98_07785 [Deltaproteobacteria bacterium]|nr:hypothetical protein [Deltaproteobacteria bacterium]
MKKINIFLLFSLSLFLFNFSRADNPEPTHVPTEKQVQASPLSQTMVLDAQRNIYFIDNNNLLFKSAFNIIGSQRRVSSINIANPKQLLTFMGQTHCQSTVLTENGELYLLLNKDTDVYYRDFIHIADNIRLAFHFNSKLWALNNHDEILIYRGTPGRVRQQAFSGDKFSLSTPEIREASFFSTGINNVFAAVPLMSTDGKPDARLFFRDGTQKLISSYAVKWDEYLSLREADFKALNDIFKFDVDVSNLYIWCSYKDKGSTTYSKYKVSHVWISKEVGSNVTIQYELDKYVFNNSPQYVVPVSDIKNFIQFFNDEEDLTRESLYLFLESIVKPLSNGDWKIKLITVTGSAPDTVGSFDGF